MELKEFIEITLLEIIQGVDSTQRRIVENQIKGIVNPVWKNADKLYEHVQDVEFDVAVTAVEKKTNGGRAGVRVFAADLGGELRRDEENTQITRIKFKVPIISLFVPVSDVFKP